MDGHIGLCLGQDFCQLPGHSKSQRSAQANNLTYILTDLRRVDIHATYQFQSGAFCHVSRHGAADGTESILNHTNLF